MNHLTSIERLLLESVSNGPKKITEIMMDTGLELKLVANLLNALTIRGFVSQMNEGYITNQRIPAGELQEINKNESRAKEAVELIEGITLHSSQKMHLRKAWVNERDRKILGALLKNLDDFIKTLPPAPRDARLQDFSIIVWGEEKYGTLINHLIGKKS